MADAEVKKSYTRCAATLFLLSALILFASVLVNCTLADYRSHAKQRAEWYRKTGDMLGRIRAYCNRSPAFFESLCLAALSSGFEIHPAFERTVHLGWPLTVEHNPSDGRITTWSNHGVLDEGVVEELRRSARSFGNQAAAIARATDDCSVRQSRLRQAVTEFFTDTVARRLLEEKSIERFAQIGDAEQWAYVVNWIVFDGWGGGFIGRPWGGGVSYMQRFSEIWDREDELFHIYRVLHADQSSDRAVGSLLAQWERAKDGLQQARREMPTLAMPGSTGNIRVDMLLMIAGPVLVFVQLLFVIFRHRAINDGLKNDGHPFTFPAFACPADPLSPPRPESFSAWGERAIWLLFLVFPSTILSAAVLTRYDLTLFPFTDFTRFILGGQPLDALRLTRETLIYMREPDEVSRLLDFANLACLLVSLLCLIDVTAKGRINRQDKPIQRFPLRKMQTFVILSLGAICFLVWAAKAHVFREIGVCPIDLWTIGIFGIVWILGLVTARAYHSRLGTVFAGGGFLLFLMFLV